MKLQLVSTKISWAVQSLLSKNKNVSRVNLLSSSALWNKNKIKWDTYFCFLLSSMFWRKDESINRCHGLFYCYQRVTGTVGVCTLQYLLGETGIWCQLITVTLKILFLLGHSDCIHYNGLHYYYNGLGTAFSWTIISGLINNKEKKVFSWILLNCFEIMAVLWHILTFGCEVLGLHKL